MGFFLTIHSRIVISVLVFCFGFLFFFFFFFFYLKVYLNQIHVSREKHNIIYIKAKVSCSSSTVARSSDRSLMVDPLSYFSFQPVFHDWCNKGCGMCNSVCGMVYTKEPLLLIGQSNPCGVRGFPLSLSEWSYTICLTPYNRK